MKKINNKLYAASYEEAKGFGRNQMNRVVNENHVSKLMKSLVHSEFSIMPPIMLNQATNHIIDGQHRLEAYLRLVEAGVLPESTTIEVYCIDLPESSELDEIIRANTNSKNWSVDDYIGCHARAGKEDYKKLFEWCKDHELTSNNGKPKYKYGGAILLGHTCYNELKNGTFTATDEQYERAEQVHAELLEITDAMGLHGSNNWIEGLIVSWMSFREKHTLGEWVKAIKAKFRTQFYQNMAKNSKRDFDAIFLQIDHVINNKLDAA